MCQLIIVFVEDLSAIFSKLRGTHVGVVGKELRGVRVISISYELMVLVPNIGLIFK